MKAVSVRRSRYGLFLIKEFVAKVKRIQIDTRAGIVISFGCKLFEEMQHVTKWR